MDLDEKKYFEKMSNYSPKNIKGYYQVMINSISQEALSGETSSIKAQMKISELLVDIEESGMVR